MIWFIIGFIVFILLVMPIELIVTYDDNQSDLDINLVKLFDIRFDLEKVIRFLFTTKDAREKITLDSIIYNLTLYFKSRNIISSSAKLTKIKKITFITYQDYENNFLVINTWILISRIQAFLKTKFSKVRNDYYMVVDNDKFYINFQAVLELRIIFIIIAIIINIKDVFKVIKFMKVYYGKSKPAKSNI